MNKSHGDFEFNMEIDLQTVTQKNEEKQWERSCGRQKRSLYSDWNLERVGGHLGGYLEDVACELQVQELSW